MNSKYLFYFCEGIGTVFDSQVLTLIIALNNKRYFKGVYLFLGISKEEQKEAFSSREIPSEIKVIFFRSYPNYPFFNYFNRRNIGAVLNEQGINLSEVLFHTRGEILAWHLSKVLDKETHCRIIPDVRGASIEEIGEFYKINKLLKILKIRNVRESVKNLKRFQIVSVVSESLKEYLISRFKIKEENIIVIPCLAGRNFLYKQAEREQIRTELNLNKEDVLIVYSSGGTAIWQNDKIVNVLAERGLKVLNLSKKNIPHKNVINRFTTYPDVPFYLNAADIAIIWREQSTVNKVASPVKFSEFISCGLPVISNYSIDMIRDYIKEHRYGVLLNRIEDIQMSTLNELKQMDRKVISKSGILNFGLDTIADKYLQIYEEKTNSLPHSFVNNNENKITVSN
jgi:glycosyltransferase involved in cell wall biosynthesis